jgi:hypothetical protein
VASIAFSPFAGFDFMPAASYDYRVDDRQLEKQLSDFLRRLGVKIRVEKLDEGIGGFCILESEPLVVLSTLSSRKQRIDVFLTALRRIDTEGIYIPPWIRDLLEENE